MATGPLLVLILSIAAVAASPVSHVVVMFVYLFVWLGLFVPLENFSLIWGRQNYRWRATHFDLYSALMTIEQWGCFNVPHLLWHGPFLYKGHLRGPLALTPVAFGRGAVTTCFNDLGLSRPDIEPWSPAHEANALPLSHRGGVVVVVVFQSISKAKRYQAVIVWRLDFGAITYEQFKDLAWVASKRGEVDKSKTKFYLQNSDNFSMNTSKSYM